MRGAAAFVFARLHRRGGELLGYTEPAADLACRTFGPTCNGDTGTAYLRRVFTTCSRGPACPRTRNSIAGPQPPSAADFTSGTGCAPQATSWRTDFCRIRLRE